MGTRPLSPPTPSLPFNNASMCSRCALPDMQVRVGTSTYHFVPSFGLFPIRPRPPNYQHISFFSGPVIVRDAFNGHHIILVRKSFDHLLRVHQLWRFRPGPHTVRVSESVGRPLSESSLPDAASTGTGPPRAATAAERVPGLTRTGAQA